MMPDVTRDELDPVSRLEKDLESLTDEMVAELRSLSAYAQRGDALAVASVAYRVRRFAQNHQMPSIQETASRIEESARRNNVPQFTSDIQLLDHQLRWFQCHG
jgi:HPt (histidine-containing phosphotransfer) domain-containing protein